MQTLLIWTAALIGPFYVILLLSILVARRLFPDAQTLYDVIEPILIFVAGACALAVAGLLAQMG